MKLVIIPDVDGDSLSIVDERFLPDNYIEVTAYNLKSYYDFDDLISLLESFNKR